MKLRVFLGAALAVFAGTAAMAEYPEKPITLVVPFPAGSPVDSSGRVVAEALEAELGQSVIVENEPGAGGTIGTRTVVNAAPDGYTLLYTTSSSTIVARAVRENLPFDPLEALIPIVGLDTTGLALQVHKSVPADDAADFLEYVKEHPGELAFATSGIGGSPHMAAETFMQTTGTEMVHIPYPGSPPANVDLIAGNVDVMFGPTPSAASNAESGNVKVLAVLGPQRVSHLEGVPTAEEAGVGQISQSPSFFAVFAPAGTPEDIVNKLESALVDYLSTDEVKERLTKMGLLGNVQSGASFKTRVREDAASVQEIVDRAGIKVE